jgi:hypothetical protein
VAAAAPESETEAGWTSTAAGFPVRDVTLYRRRIAASNGAAVITIDPSIRISRRSRRRGRELHRRTGSGRLRVRGDDDRLASRRLCEKVTAGTSIRIGGDRRPAGAVKSVWVLVVSSDE